MSTVTECATERTSTRSRQPPRYPRSPTVRPVARIDRGRPRRWQPDCLRSWMQDPDGDGVYTFATDQFPAGDYELKVALDEAWTDSYPGSNVPFTAFT